MNLQVKEKISKLNIELTAKETEFYKRKPKKISATNFIISFICLMNAGKFSLKEWAFQISELTTYLVSHQGIAKKLSFRSIKFVDKLLEKALLDTLKKTPNIDVNETIKSFGRVLVEDSTCFNLPQNLFPFFKGSSNQHSGNQATGKVQLRVNIKDNNYENIELMSFRDSDAKYASKLLEMILPGDLILRDLGYWKKEIFTAIHKAEAFFLSRLKLSVNIYNPKDEEKLNLYNYLRKQERNGISTVDIPVKLEKNGVEFRLVAFKLTDAQAQKRRRVAKQNRNSKAKTISKETNYLLSWNLFVMNVSEKVWKVEDIYPTYQLRWNIETIFKNWKSNFKLVEFLKTSTGRNPARPEIILKLHLIWVVLVFNQKFNYYQSVIYKEYKKFLSPGKFANFLKQNFKFVEEMEEEIVIKKLQYYCCFDIRYDRKNYFENLYMIT